MINRRATVNIGTTDLRDALDLSSDTPLNVPINVPINVPSPTKQLMPAAARLAADLDHRVYDGMYLALAIQE